MSRTPRQTRVASDFSIARILADDSGEKKFRAPANRAESVDVGRINDASLPSFARRECAIGSFALRGDRVFRPAGDERVSGAENSQRGFPQQLGAARFERGELAWLQCTRYRPPKIPRKTAAGKSGKRRPGAHPRIPFTASQLQVLEDKYRGTAYLSRRDVVQLSTALRLPQSRVKIWFQNRRARDRRESSAAATNPSTDDRTRDTTTPSPV